MHIGPVWSRQYGETPQYTRSNFRGCIVDQGKRSFFFFFALTPGDFGSGSVLCPPTRQWSPPYTRFDFGGCIVDESNYFFPQLFFALTPGDFGYGSVLCPPTPQWPPPYTR